MSDAGRDRSGRDGKRAQQQPHPVRSLGSPGRGNSYGDDGDSDDIIVVNSDGDGDGSSSSSMFEEDRRDARRANERAAGAAQPAPATQLGVGRARDLRCSDTSDDDFISGVPDAANRGQHVATGDTNRIGDTVMNGSADEHIRDRGRSTLSAPAAQPSGISYYPIFAAAVPMRASLGAAVPSAANDSARLLRAEGEMRPGTPGNAPSDANHNAGECAIDSASVQVPQMPVIPPMPVHHALGAPESEHRPPPPPPPLLQHKPRPGQIVLHAQRGKRQQQHEPSTERKRQRPSSALDDSAKGSGSGGGLVAPAQAKLTQPRVSSTGLHQDQRLPVMASQPRSTHESGAPTAVTVSSPRAAASAACNLDLPSGPVSAQPTCAVRGAHVDGRSSDGATGQWLTEHGCSGPTLLVAAATAPVASVVQPAAKAAKSGARRARLRRAPKPDESAGGDVVVEPMQPSAEDREATQRVHRLCKMLDTTLLDAALRDDIMELLHRRYRGGGGQRLGPARNHADAGTGTACLHHSSASKDGLLPSEQPLYPRRDGARRPPRDPSPSLTDLFDDTASEASASTDGIDASGRDEVNVDARTVRVTQDEEDEYLLDGIVTEDDYRDMLATHRWLCMQRRRAADSDAESRQRAFRYSIRALGERAIDDARFDGEAASAVAQSAMATSGSAAAVAATEMLEATPAPQPQPPAQAPSQAPKTADVRARVDAINQSVARAIQNMFRRTGVTQTIAQAATDAIVSGAYTAADATAREAVQAALSAKNLNATCEPGQGVFDDGGGDNDTKPRSWNGGAGWKSSGAVPGTPEPGEDDGEDDDALFLSESDAERLRSATRTRGPVSRKQPRDGDDAASRDGNETASLPDAGAAAESGAGRRRAHTVVRTSEELLERFRAKLVAAGRSPAEVEAEASAWLERRAQAEAQHAARVERERQRRRASALKMVVQRHVVAAQRQLVAQRVVVHGNARRVAQIVQREVRRRVVAENRLTAKNVLVRARRAIREVLVFWKRYEREEREERKQAEREALERMRKEAELQEARRQQRKLNFLITQTELYAHFMSNKMRNIASDATVAALPATSGDGAEAAAAAAGISEILRSLDDSTANDASGGASGDRSDGMQPETAVELEERVDTAELQRRAMSNAQRALQATLERTQRFDEATRKLRAAAVQDGGMSAAQLALDETASLANPSTLQADKLLKQPALFRGTLKSYQLKGISWLASLFDHGINGILADEMGLGKTVQTLGLLAHLAEAQGIWGPFLIVAPASTLHNWQQEFERFVPALKVLPYWGTQEVRRILRQFWRDSKLYTPESPFHAVVTSYQIILADEKHFRRVKWQYMVLDEAQAIKSSASQRWNVLLGFECRNRLLLSGTPIQNSMAELWALLHFIMPTLFDSHKEFAEWFSKDIESHAVEKTAGFDPAQLSRLHMILKPFMLRRIKRDVEHELGEKREIEVGCDLTPRQQRLYRAVRDKIPISELLQHGVFASDVRMNQEMAGLMNLLMQLRKVCNHPELFERRRVVSSFVCRTPGEEPTLAAAPARTASASTSRLLLDTTDDAASILDRPLPRLIYTELLHPSARCSDRRQRPGQALSLLSPYYIHRSATGDGADAAAGAARCFSFVRLSALSPSQAGALLGGALLERAVLHAYLSAGQVRSVRSQALSASAPPLLLLLPPPSPGPALVPRAWSRGAPGAHIATDSAIWRGLLRISSRPLDQAEALRLCATALEGIIPRTVAPTPSMLVCHRGATDAQMDVRRLRDVWLRRALLGSVVGPTADAGASVARSRCLSLAPTYTTDALATAMAEMDECAAAGIAAGCGDGLLGPPSRTVLEAQAFAWTSAYFPPRRLLISDSGKMRRLDLLLDELKRGGHRVLIYCQMTRMIDLLEEYMIFRRHQYMRLDGSSKICDRRDMVADFQSRSDIFAFLLSTRAGGLGINLTAADTVIFYDSDWNPTVDQQAMDRAHRLGQTKEVTVYRLITRGTVESRILERAKQKSMVRAVAMAWAVPVAPPLMRARRGRFMPWSSRAATLRLMRYGRVRWFRCCSRTTK